MSTGERVQELRKTHGQTRDQLAEKIMESPRALGNWERGERKFPYEVIMRIADLYDVSLDYLFCRTNDPYIIKKTSQDSVDLVIDVPGVVSQAPVAVAKLKMPKTPEELKAFILQVVGEAGDQHE